MTLSRQAYAFVFMDSAIADAGGVGLDRLHCDVEAIARSYAAIAPVARRLGVPAPVPKLAGFAYSHVSALGAPVRFAAGSEPNVDPCLHAPADIDRLREPDDYLAAGVVPERLRTLAALRARFPDAPATIGHLYEGPITTASLLLGPDFFLLPLDDPPRAHRLLEFCVRSALRYQEVLLRHLGMPRQPGPVWMPDDFAGMLSPRLFPEFVVPYWNQMYAGLQATERHLHSELLRPEHLGYLPAVKLTSYDPCADQYVTPELMRAQCPVPFHSEILSWHVRDLSAAQLQEKYRAIARCRPELIVFAMTFVAEEPKIAALLATARELAGET